MESTCYVYFNEEDPFHKMLGCKYYFDSRDNILQTVTGQAGTIADSKTYTSINDSATCYLDWIVSDGCDLLFESDRKQALAGTYEGKDKNYRLIFSSFMFTFIRGQSERDELMGIYLKYLLDGTPIVKKPVNQANTNNGMVLTDLYVFDNQIGFILNQPSPVTIDFYNLTGRYMYRFIDRELSSGAWQFDLSNTGKLFGSGKYILRIRDSKETGEHILIDLKK